MNQFLENIRKQCGFNLTHEQFIECLLDEEYLEGNALHKCFYCDFDKFDMIIGGKDVYDYIHKRMSDLSEPEEVHRMGLLCNWLQSKGVPIFANAEKFPHIKILICYDCGRILGVNLKGKWEYPYIGQLYKHSDRNFETMNLKNEYNYLRDYCLKNNF